MDNKTKKKDGSSLKNFRLLRKSISCTLLSLFFGIVIVVATPFVKKFIRVKWYTVKHSEFLFKNWDKEKLVMNSSGQNFRNFIEENNQFVIFFWATWCPYCKKTMDVNKFLEEHEITVIGLPYDYDFEYFDWFINKHKFSWDNLILQNCTEKTFVQRKAHFYIPLIPSWWLIKNGTVTEIFIGEKGKQKLLLYFK